MQLRHALVDRDAIHDARDRLPVIRERRDVGAHQICGTRYILAEQNGVKRLCKFIRRTDSANLSNLIQHVLVVHRIERILLLKLCDHELQKRVHVNVVDRIAGR